jgi:molybdopterin-guanine dinucleotide biosynthesis protein A
MGSDKALIGLEGKPLLAVQLDRLRAAGAGELLVSVAPASSLPASFEPRHPIRWVIDSAPDGGPLAGVEAVFREATHGRVVVLAVDLPGLTPAFVAELVARSASGIGVVPRWEGRWEPLCAVYPREPALREIGSMAGSRERAVRRLVERGVAAGWLRPWELAANQAPNLANWNRPEDWRPGEPRRAGSPGGAPDQR